MTDKQIIIFGVDVSKCPYAEPAYGSPKCSINRYIHCDGFRNCEYKQLKRSEAQCEAMFVSHTDLEKKYKTKEQECEELKKQRQADKGLITSTGKMNYQLLQEYDRLKTENEHLKNNDVFSVRYFKDKNDKLRQTLTEIKQIAENVIKNVSDRCIETTPMYYIHKQIIQKISEVEDDR